MNEILKEKKRVRVKIAVMFLLLIISALMSMTLGRYAVSAADIFRAVAGQPITPEIRQVLFVVRLPRLLAAILIGVSLAVSGASYQGMFKNPLVSPDILGSSAGAGFGAALAILFSLSVPCIKISAFFFGLAAVLITWFISTRFGKGDDNLFLLILGGIIVSHLFQSMISLVKYVADPTDKLPSITFWLMGSLSKVTMRDIRVSILPILICSLVLICCSAKLNILSFGKEEARTLGVNTERLQFVIIIMATILTAFSVSMCGMIGWIGLVVPHLTRMLVGPDFRYLIPASMIIGGLYMLIMDTICRTVMMVELPIGILTSLAGLPFFLYLLTRKNKGW